MTTELLTKIEEVAKGFHAYQEVQEQRMKKYDALDEDKINKIIKSVTEAEEQRQKLERLEAAVNRPEFSRDADDKTQKEERAKKFDAFLREGAANKAMEIRAMQTADNAMGGYLVRPEFANFIVDRVFESSPLRQLANVQTIGGNSLTIDIDDDEAAGGWGSELGSVSETDTPDVGQVTINAYKLVAEPGISTELIQDAAYDVEAWLQGKVSDKFSRLENTAFVSGNGVGKPKGLLSYADWSSAGVYTRDALERIASGSNTAITADGLISLQNSLKEAYQANASFLMKRATFGDVMKIKDTNTYHFLGLQPANKQGSVMELTLLGKKVTFADDFDANGTQNNIVAAYGDYSRGYTIVDKTGLTILRNPFRTSGKVIYQCEKRTGGAVTNYEAIKLLDNNAS